MPMMSTADPLNSAVASRLGGAVGRVNSAGGDPYMGGGAGGMVDRSRMSNPDPYRPQTSMPQQTSTPNQPLQNNTLGAFNYQKPQRQTNNDQGWFGGQAGNVNARLSQLLNPDYATVRRTDSEISPLFQQIDRQSVQSARQMQQAAAERAAAEGTLQGGGFSSTANQINEQARESAGDRQAELMYNASNRRQGQIDNALGLAANLAEGQQGRNLQREGMDLENEQFWQNLGLQREDLGLRAELGRGDLALRGELGRGDLNLRGELGRGQLAQSGQQISNQNNQFYDRLGFDKSSFEAQMNNNIINQLLGF
jgi:hypothetical protein